MTDFDKVRIERLTDRIQHAVGLIAYLQRAHQTTQQDLQTVEQALRTATAELHALRDSSRQTEVGNR